MAWLYYALAFFVVAVLMLVLGFAGVARGAAGMANLALLMSLVILAVGSLVSFRRGHFNH